MSSNRFDVSKLERLNNPERLREFPIDLVIEKTQLKNPKCIVDLGAGTGFFSIPFADKFKSCKIYACDISDVMINWMQENIVGKYPNIEPLKMENNSVSVESDSADFLFMVNLHHELDSPELTLNECFRLLKKGGSIAISDWRKEQMERGPSFEIRYEPRQIEHQLLNTGFSDIRVYNDFPNNFLVIARK